jgi:hypothetical protein
VIEKNFSLSNPTTALLELIKKACLILCATMFISLYTGVSLKPAPIVTLIILILLTKVFCLLKRISVTFLARFVFLLISLYPGFIFFVQLAYFWNVEQGLDFGIFSQVIYQVAINGSPQSSIVAQDKINFLTYHFSPYLNFLGLVAKLGLPPEYILLSSQALAVLGLILALIFFLTAFKVSLETKAAIISAVLLLPSVRRGLAWGVYDEILALPFLLTSLALHFWGKHKLKIVALICCFFFKETFALVCCCFCIVFAIEATTQRSFYIALASLSLLAFFVYSAILPTYFYQPAFKPFDRISRFDDLLNFELLNLKLKWVALIFAPCLPLTLALSAQEIKKVFLLLVTAGFHFVAMLITNFENMLNPYNYYSVTPAILTFLAFCCVSCKRTNVWPALLISLIIISILGPRIKISRLAKVFESSHPIEEIKQFVTSNSTIVADDYTLSILGSFENPKRLYGFNFENMRFDVVVLKKGSKTLNLSQKYLIKCFETKTFEVFCPRRKNQEARLSISIDLFNGQKVSLTI